MTEFEKKVYEIVRKIPAGKVSTYGKIARQLGNVNYSRAVGNAMHKNPVPYVELACLAGYEVPQKMNAEQEIQMEKVPCHRVVNSSGKMGANFGLGGPEIQKKMLEAEGVEIQTGKVDLIKYMY